MKREKWRHHQEGQDRNVFVRFKHTHKEARLSLHSELGAKLSDTSDIYRHYLDIKAVHI